MTKTSASVIFVLGALAVCAQVSSATAAEQAKSSQDLAMTPTNVKWVSCGVPEFPGCEAAMLDGDPAKGPYSMYVRLPAGGAFPPHHHTNGHYLVGVSGTLTFKYEDGNTVALSPGAFVYWPGKELMQGRCGDDAPCVYYDHQNGFGDVHMHHAEK